MHVKCLPDARVSFLVGDDSTLRASAQHLSENFMRFASAEPPPYRPLSCCLARKEISQTMRNDHLSIYLSGSIYVCIYLSMFYLYLDLSKNPIRKA